MMKEHKAVLALLFCCLMRQLHAARNSASNTAVEAAPERWELPQGAAYKNTMPLIGIMTQPCLRCPGESFVEMS